MRQEGLNSYFTWQILHYLLKLWWEESFGSLCVGKNWPDAKLYIAYFAFFWESMCLWMVNLIGFQVKFLFYLNAQSILKTEISEDLQ